MAEYIGSSVSSTRRRGIIREARFPKTSIVAQYDMARNGLVNFLTDGTRSFRHIADAADKIAKRDARADATDWIKRDCRLSTEAMDAFQRSYNKTSLRKLDCRPILSRLAPLQIGPTKINVTMDFTVHRAGRDDNPDSIGGAILLFSKGESSGKARVERSKAIAGLIYTWCTEHMKSMGTPDPEVCFAVDTFAGLAYTPPGTFAKKLRNVEDASAEIAVLWETIDAPDDYDGPPY